MKYIIKRIIWSAISLMVIILIGFTLLIYTPGDPIRTVMNLSDQEDPLRPPAPIILNQKKTWENKLGLNLPLFYFTIQSSVLPDTLYRVTDKHENKIIRSLCLQTGTPDKVLKLRDELKQLSGIWLNEVKTLPPNKFDSLHNRINEVNYHIQLLHQLNDINSIHMELNLLKEISYDFQKTNECIHDMLHSFDLKSQIVAGTFVPKIRFHRTNRFHHWLFGDGSHSFGILRGDFGISYVSKEPIRNHIYKNLFWSVFFSGLAILLAYLISIPVGIRSAVKNGSLPEKLMTVILFILYSIPVFFMGTLLQTFLANNEYLHLFEPSGIKPSGGYPSQSGWFTKIGMSLPYIVLPLICFIYSSLAFLTRLTKTSILEELGKPYIITAKAKGLPYKSIIYKHALRNALIPLLTVFTNLFPVLVGGSVVIETIFTIPGMGTEMFNAYFTHNIPVIISIFTLTGMFTIAGFLISDVLNVTIDPRIRK